MAETSAATSSVGWHRRSKFTKMLTVALVVMAALLLPTAGSFVPRESGNVLFGGEAQAACKTALQNPFNAWYFEANVITSWCYNGRSVTSRNSRAGGNVTNLGVLGGFVLLRQHWEYSACHYYNGTPNHNCLTQREFWLLNLHSGDEVSVCIGTRIYGGGGHHRGTNTASNDACNH